MMSRFVTQGLLNALAILAKFGFLPLHSSRVGESYRATIFEQDVITSTGTSSDY
jgi:hypothetical protein